jgi:hypothetical protein
MCDVFIIRNAHGTKHYVNSHTIARGLLHAAVQGLGGTNAINANGGVQRLAGSGAAFSNFMEVACSALSLLWADNQ